MLTKSVDTQSIRHESVQAVSASQGWMFGKIQVDLGARVIVIDNCDKEAVSTIASLANKWLRIHKKEIKQQRSELSTTELLLIKTQIDNQERIISILEEINKKITAE